VALELITGPAGCGKTEHLLQRYVSMLDQEPVLVVAGQRLRDLQQRRLAKRGAVFGQRVLTLDEVFELAFYQTGSSVVRVLTPTQRELILRTVCDATELEALRASSRHQGFTASLGRFFGELERAMVTPETFEKAASGWAKKTARANYACELARLYAAYHRYLSRLGALDDDLVKWRSVEALRQDPESWQKRPVFFDGFDDLSPVGISLIEAVAQKAEVSICLTYERGRAASSALEPLIERLERLASHTTTLSRSNRAPRALNHLEGQLFSDTYRRAQSEDAVRCQLAGGQRCEIELVGAKVIELIRSGLHPEKIALGFRSPQAYAPLVRQVFTAYGIPFSMRVPVRLYQTAFGRGFLALVGLATGSAGCESLIAYLRTPGVTDRPHTVDALEQEVRAHAIRSPQEARRRWESQNRTLYELDRLLACEDAGEFIDELDSQLQRLFAAFQSSKAPNLSVEDQQEVGVFKTICKTLAEARDQVVVSNLTSEAVYTTLCATTATVGPSPGMGRVRVGGCEEISGERFDAVFVCGLQEGDFPKSPSPPACIGEGDRRELASIAGDCQWLIDGRWLERERYLFYRLASSADTLLVLSSCVSDEEGNPKPRSFFLNSVEDLFTDELAKSRRLLSDVTWDPEVAPTPTEFDRGIALLGPRSYEQPPNGLCNPKVLAELATLTTFSASALEAFANCPVRWLLEHMVKPTQIEPESQQLARGRHAHQLLCEIYKQLQQTGARGVTEDNLADVEATLENVISQRGDSFKNSDMPPERLLGTTRLKQDLLEHLRQEATDNSAFEPTKLELGFGGELDQLPAMPLDDQDLYVRGKIDRLDIKNDCAVVRDYKSAGSAAGVARWEEDNRLQVSLYLLAVKKLLGLEPAAGLYVPLSGQDRRPRGALVTDASDDLGQGFVKTDWVSKPEIETKLECVGATAAALAKSIREGTVYPRPDTCKGGRCAYPSICRQEQAG
jgi:ATP-dependent helicase/DNAse subunit B